MHIVIKLFLSILVRLNMTYFKLLGTTFSLQNLRFDSGWLHAIFTMSDLVPKQVFSPKFISFSHANHYSTIDPLSSTTTLETHDSLHQAPNYRIPSLQVQTLIWLQKFSFSLDAIINHINNTFL
jgi:hypothetical protein